MIEIRFHGRGGQGAVTAAEIGLGSQGKVILNTQGEAPEHEDYETHVIDATGIALEKLGLPIVNTVMLGAFAGATGQVSIDSIIKIIKETFPGKIGEKNADAAKVAYDHIK